MRVGRVALLSAIALATSLSAEGADLPNVYRNVEVGFSIRCAVSMKPVLRDPDEFGGTDMGWKLVLDFVTSGDNPVTALRLIVKEPRLPTYPPTDLAALRAVCKTYAITSVGQRLALTCVTCGRAACSWTVHVQGQPEFSILSLDHEASTTSVPEDGDLPIRSMIESIRFEAR